MGQCQPKNRAQRRRNVLGNTEWGEVRYQGKNTSLQVVELTLWGPGQSKQKV